MKKIKFLSILVVSLLVITGCTNNEELNKNEETNNEKVETIKIEDKTLKCTAVGNYDADNCSFREDVVLTFNFKDDKVVSATYDSKETVVSGDCWYDNNNVITSQANCPSEEMYSDKCEVKLISEHEISLSAYRDIQKNEKTLFGFETLDMSKYNTYEEVYNFMTQDENDETQEENNYTHYFKCE